MRSTARPIFVFVNALAFVMRPVGGVIFGIMGDKTGRKRALQISMVMMFSATFVMGCLPTVDTIGIWAPILLTVLRLFQGVSVGGQLVGSILFLIGTPCILSLFLSHQLQFLL